MNPLTSDTRLPRLLAVWLGMVLASTAFAAEPQPAGGAAADAPATRRMWMAVGAHRFAVTLADNVAAAALVDLLPITLEMVELNGNEKYARLARPLPSQPELLGTIRRGDILLYGDDTLVVFYETFRSSHRYTRIGHVVDPKGLADALGAGNSQVAFSLR